MTAKPLRRIFISDFRRLDGHHTFPLDAPIVLIHGPNGTGKTSVLSAIEMALTGEIRSMRRHDTRYTAHLPSHGHDFATIRVEVDESYAAVAEPETMTVGGNRIEGRPTLSESAAQFFAERSYLDQVSLGQLLELYQYTEGKSESALARFVNELLGLERLDALREGLSSANDLRNLKKLSEPLSDADAEAQRATKDLSQASAALSKARAELDEARQELLEESAALELGAELDGESSLRNIADVLRSSSSTLLGSTAALDRRVAALGGRLSALGERPSMQRLDDLRASLDAASAEFSDWTATHSTAIERWRADVAKLQLPVTAGSLAATIDTELQRVDRELQDQAILAEGLPELDERVGQARAQLQAVEEELSGAQVAAGTLVEGLTALREHSTEDVCPVCDRSFGEIGAIHLTDHIDQKLAELTNQGAHLRDLRQRKDALAAQLQSDEQTREEQGRQLWSASQRELFAARVETLRNLRRQFDDLEPVIATGFELRQRVDEAQRAIDDLEAVASDESLARAELSEIAETVGAPSADEGQSLQEAWRLLADFVSTLSERSAAHQRAVELSERAEGLEETVTSLKEEVAEIAERKESWEGRVQEAKRRQAVARKIHGASAKARASIVQRVFTESLNDVWRSVFTRLAPREPYVPKFGIPGTSKTALELTLETEHASGEAGGSPQMMLSAGNLNTAALSLFIALHLAVEPTVPCLVFDDPVQSMDEVHVAQLAGLLRVLSKHHERQLVVAVHERELFQYLTLELSPAFAGDELLTIELGARLADDDHGVTRYTWSPDRAIAM